MKRGKASEQERAHKFEDGRQDVMNIRPSKIAAFSTMTTKASKAIVNVDITSDLMCPWCWVGLCKLQLAAKETGIATNITWKPFLLRPNIPIEGQPKGGTPESRTGQQLKHAGKSVGIDFTGLTDRTPNTILFHATIKMLQDHQGREISR
jgi:predicted DsbA family dithiol-disulfide isomerase